MILELLFAILSFVLSPMGMATFGAGVILFIALPIIPKVTGVGHAVNSLYLTLATKAIGRAAVVVSEHNDIYFKTMQYDDRGVEKVSFGTDTKEFEDPDGALHYWMGIPFALADEVHGVLFDPRHAALGQRKHDSDERDESSYLATTDEWEDDGVSVWQRGVFEMPSRHELVDLGRIRELVDGGERSEYPARVESLYKNSRDPFGSGLPIMKFLMPAIAFLITFGGIWLVVTKIGGSGGGSAPDQTIEYGLLTLFASLTAPDIDRAKAIVGGLALAGLGTLAALFVFLGPMMTVVVLFVGGAGFLLLPTLAILSRPIGPISGMFANLFFRLGFLGYQRPVFEWTPSKYRLREFSDVDTTEDLTWYNLFGQLVGFTFDPSPDSWGAEVMERDELESRQMVADGGDKASTNIPDKYVRTNAMQRGDYGAFIPKRLKRSKYYLHTGIALARFKNSATGEKSLRRLLQAKESGEDGSSVSDKMVMYMTAAGGLLGAILGVLVFIL